MNKYSFLNGDILDRIVSEAEEERISKKKIFDIYINNMFIENEGSSKNLIDIHKYIFEDCFKKAGILRKLDVRKGMSFFCRAMYLESNLEIASKMKQNTLDEIIEKYVEMNILHPFYEGNGRATRVWIDLLLRKRFNKFVNWINIDRDEYILAMERSFINTLEIKYLIKENLIDISSGIDFSLLAKNIDVSYKYEGLYNYKTEDILD